MYLHFCSCLNISPVPISPSNLGRYIAFLANKLCFSSIRQYLNVVRLLHLEAGYANPLSENWYLSSILKGLRRFKGQATVQKLPITCSILQGILGHLNFSRPFDLAFWAACLVGFFSFFRKSNLLVSSLAKFDPSKHLCYSDVLFQPSGAVLTVRWSKTIQFKQRILHIPLPRMVNSPFCPSAALMLCRHMLPHLTDPFPLFCYPASEGIKPLTHTEFVDCLRNCLSKLGLDPSVYSGHSLRRGGASFALQCGLSSELIKLQGDWASNAYEKYLNPSFSLRKQVATTLGQAFPALPVTSR